MHCQSSGRRPTIRYLPRQGDSWQRQACRRRKGHSMRVLDMPRVSRMVSVKTVWLAPIHLHSPEGFEECGDHRLAVDAIVGANFRQRRGFAQHDSRLCFAQWRPNMGIERQMLCLCGRLGTAHPRLQLYRVQWACPVRGNLQKRYWAAARLRRSCFRAYFKS